jgi:opine dehydrogenase
MIVSVLGAGNGACATAADWALSGHEVRMYDFDQYHECLEPIQTQGGIHVIGDLEGFAPVAYAGSDIRQAIDGADLIIAVGPAYSSGPFANQVKKHIRRNQTYIVSPGSNGGALLTKKIFQDHENAKDVVVAETATLPYASRITKPGTVKVHLKLVGGLYLAAIPGDKTHETLEMYRQVYPFATPGENIFRTILQNANPVIHPVVTVMNAARIEGTKGDFSFYEEGVTPAIGRMIEAVDLERIQIGKALGMEIIADPELGVLQGYMTEASYTSGYSSAPGFKGIRAQQTLQHRYLDEDVGYGLVFLSELGRSLGVETPMMDAVIAIASTLAERDYRKEALRTLEGIGYTVDEVHKL